MFTINSLLCALRVGMVAGFVVPFCTLPKIFHRNANDGDSFSAKHRVSKQITHKKHTPCRTNSVRRIRTCLFSHPTDEDLFLSLFREKEEQKAADEATARKIPPPSYDPATGAGVPRASLEPDEIVPLLMTALQNVDVPNEDGGLIAMWDFASDTTKFVFKNNRTEFIESCHQTAREFPTSFYGAAMTGQSWTIETELNRVGGNTGWIATQVTSTISSDGRLRRWQWELRKNRRPPCLGCWKVENIASSDRKGNFEPD